MKGYTPLLLQEFDHKFSLLIALDAAFISFSLINAVFRDSSRSYPLVASRIVHSGRSPASLPHSA
jgi:hypothetical protein